MLTPLKLPGWWFFATTGRLGRVGCDLDLGPRSLGGTIWAFAGELTGLRDGYTSGDTWPGFASEFCKDARNLATVRRGGMAEWSMAVVLKTTVPERVPGVRIPLPPPQVTDLLRNMARS